MSLALASLLLWVLSTAGKIIYAGVNESGGEFGVFGTFGTGLPGQFGVDYAFINKSTIDIYVDQEHINLFRVTFLLERMCPLSHGYGLGARFNETHFAEYQDAINYITWTKSSYAIIDPHNYYRYNDPSNQPSSGSVIGNTSDPNAATTAQWAAFNYELGLRFRDNPRVIFGLQNEPHDMPTTLVLQNDQAAINALRSAGAEQLILAPGNGYTGGHGWNSSASEQNDQPSSEVMYKIWDPIGNTAIDIHEYLDEDFSGTHDACNQSGPANLEYLTGWLKEHNLKALVSEFGGGRNVNCYHYIGDLLSYLAENDVYIGWAAWAAGPLWGTFRACCGDDSGNLEPGTQSVNGTVLQPGGFVSQWKKAIQPHVPGDLKREGVSNLYG